MDLHSAREFTASIGVHSDCRSPILKTSWLRAHALSYERVLTLLPSLFPHYFPHHRLQLSFSFFVRFFFCLFFCWLVFEPVSEVSHRTVAFCGGPIVVELYAASSFRPLVREFRVRIRIFCGEKISKKLQFFEFFFSNFLFLSENFHFLRNCEFFGSVLHFR